MVKRLCILSVIMSVSAVAVPIGTCVSGTLNTYIGNPCALGDQVFDNFAYSGNVAPSNVSIEFESVGTEFHLILAPVTGAGFFTNLSLSDTVSVTPDVAPNISPANYQIVGVKDQSNFSAMPDSAGLLNVVNSPGPTYDLVPGNETSGPTFFAGTTSVTTVSTLTGPSGTDGANPGLASFELDYIQANTELSDTATIPEPATFGLIGIALVGGGLFRKRPVYYQVGNRSLTDCAPGAIPSLARPIPLLRPDDATTGLIGVRARIGATELRPDRIP